MDVRLWSASLRQSFFFSLLEQDHLQWERERGGEQLCHFCCSESHEEKKEEEEEGGVFEEEGERPILRQHLCCRDTSICYCMSSFLCRWVEKTSADVCVRSHTLFRKQIWSQITICIRFASIYTAVCAPSVMTCTSLINVVFFSGYFLSTHNSTRIFTYFCHLSLVETWCKQHFLCISANHWMTESVNNSQSICQLWGHKHGTDI